jgi:hypothetical protein
VNGIVPLVGAQVDTPDESNEKFPELVVKVTNPVVGALGIKALGVTPVKLMPPKLSVVPGVNPTLLVVAGIPERLLRLSLRRVLTGTVKSPVLVPELYEKVSVFGDWMVPPAMS